MKEKQWHRRHAIGLAAQLPDGKEDALLILDAARRLVTLPSFWNGEPEKKPATVGSRRPSLGSGGDECAYP
jgi:hypothetical protein